VPTLGLVNIGAVATGVLSAPRLEAEAILVEGGKIAAIGAASKVGAARADVVVDCLGTMVMPGLIDSHCHVVLGDYTPRQKTVDFLDSYVHGGITSVVSAGEGVHAPGRPHDAVAAKALAIAAAKCFEHFHPNGMKVNAGSVVLEPGLTAADFAEMAKHGVRHPSRETVSPRCGSLRSTGSASCRTAAVLRFRAPARSATRSCCISGLTSAVT
jgi:enamidase